MRVRDPAAVKAAVLGGGLGLALGLLFLLATAGWGQTPFSQNGAVGSANNTNTLPVGNQAVYATLLVKSDTTVFPATRAINIGDAAACNIAVRFVANPTQTITLTNQQVGSDHSYSIVQLMAATTCASVTALY